MFTIFLSLPPSVRPSVRPSFSSDALRAAANVPKWGFTRKHHLLVYRIPLSQGLQNLRAGGRGKGGAAEGFVRVRRGRGVLLVMQCVALDNSRAHADTHNQQLRFA